MDFDMDVDSPTTDPPLFASDLIDEEVIHQIPQGFILRPIHSSDFSKGYLQALAHLTFVGTISKKLFVERLAYYCTIPDTYYLVVVEDIERKKIVGCGTMFLERKMIHNLGSCGHLEDVVTLPEYRGLQLGRLIIQALTSVSKNMGAYKTILDCSEKNIPFYSRKCGFSQKEYQMAIYHDEGYHVKARL